MLFFSKSLAVASGLLFTLVAAVPTPATCDTTICVTKVNECGLKYGACYLIPECGGEEPDWVIPPCPTATPCTTTICIDAISECGVRFGGCYEIECGAGPPTLTPPPCPTSTAV